jgi:hypothetical protein
MSELEKFGKNLQELPRDMQFIIFDSLDYDNLIQITKVFKLNENTLQNLKLALIKKIFSKTRHRLLYHDPLDVMRSAYLDKEVRHKIMEIAKRELFNRVQQRAPIGTKVKAIRIIVKGILAQEFYYDFKQVNMPTDVISKELMKDIINVFEISMAQLDIDEIREIDNAIAESYAHYRDYFRD